MKDNLSWLCMFTGMGMGFFLLVKLPAFLALLGYPLFRFMGSESEGLFLPSLGAYAYVFAMFFFFWAGAKLLPRKKEEPVEAGENKEEEGF